MGNDQHIPTLTLLKPDPHFAMENFIIYLSKYMVRLVYGLAI